MNHLLKNRIKSILFTSERGHKLYSILARQVQKKRSALSDKDYVVLAFKENTGVDLNLENPRTFNDKLLWLSLNDHDPLKTICADKYRVREYIADQGFEYILNELYGVYDTVNDIDFDKLPDEFFIKTNHDSGTYALIKKNDFDIPQILNKVEMSLHRNYYFESREWQYKDIQPKIICEEVLRTDDPLGLIDYRFYCFNGVIGFIAVDIGTTDPNGKHAYVAKRNLYDLDFNYINAKLRRENFDPDLVKKPVNFDEMKRIAVALSQPFKHVRIDLYNVDGRIVFGEMTFCNAGGMQLLEPESFNLKIGDMISLE